MTRDHYWCLVVVLGLLLGDQQQAAADIYRWQDKAGNWHFSDTRPPTQNFTVKKTRASQPNQSFDSGLLWALSHPHHATSYVLGTVHVFSHTMQKFMDEAPAIQQSLASTSQYCMEVILDNDFSQAFIESARLPSSMRSSQFLDATTVQLVAEWGAKRGLSRHVLDRIEPWYLYMTSGRGAYPNATQHASVDNYWLAQALSSGLDICEVETKEQHIQAISNANRTQYNALIKAQLQQTTSEIDEVLALYWKQDIAGMLTRSSINRAKKPELWASHKKFMYRLLAMRNVAMATRIHRKATSRSTFAAVGAAHLSGNDGILAKLAAKGWTITNVPLQP